MKINKNVANAYTYYEKYNKQLTMKNVINNTMYCVQELDIFS